MARLAGMPAAVVNHARHALGALEASASQTQAAGRPVRAAAAAAEAADPSAVEARLAEIDPDALSPRDALDALYVLKKLAAKS